METVLDRRAVSDFCCNPRYEQLGILLTAPMGLRRAYGCRLDALDRPALNGDREELGEIAGWLLERALLEEAPGLQQCRQRVARVDGAGGVGLA